MKFILRKVFVNVSILQTEISFSAERIHSRNYGRITLFQLSMKMTLSVIVSLKFSDNDELATLLAVGFGAETLMFCTSVGGLLDEAGNIIGNVSNVNEVFKFVRTDKSFLGLGGMASKLTFAKLAARMAIKVVIFGMKQQDELLKALEGKAGTVMSPGKSTLSARNRWLGSGGLVSGRLQIDEGATKALIKKKKSCWLLA